jgi:hypothetical protein
MRRNYDAAFKDCRPPRILFVLAKRDARAVDPRLRDRRLRAINAMAEKVFGRAAEPPVSAVYLDDVAGIRAACGLATSGRPPLPLQMQPRPQEPAPQPMAALARADLELLTRFYEWSRQAHRRLHPASRVRQPLKETGREVRSLLLRCRGTKAPVLGDFPTHA